MTLTVRLSGRVGAVELEAAFSAMPGVSVIQGPSGSGKTTLLRAIAGLHRLRGEVRLGARTWQDADTFVPTHRRGLGCVFQDANLLPHLSTRANLAYAARRAEAPLPIEDIARRTGITHLLDRGSASLSGGEAQRVALARALLIRPSLLLLDEPWSALDGAARESLGDCLAALLPALAIPALLVTHDRVEIPGLAERRFAMTEGTLVADP